MTNLELEALLRLQIPLTEAMQLAVENCSPETVCLRAPLAPNRNLHGTAFAGSLYSLATLTGWSLVTLFAQSRGYEGALVLRQAQVRYQRPVTGELKATAQLPAPTLQQAFLDALARKGRGRIDMNVEIRQGEQLAFEFVGEFVLHCGEH